MASILLNALVWLLLLACVGLLIAAAVSWGAFAALRRAVAQGVTAADAALAPAGLTLASASDLAAAAAAALRLPGGGAAFAGLPFSPICLPTCLNAGSFAPLLRMRESCVCGRGRGVARGVRAARGPRGPRGDRGF